ncbi:MAG: hypothetical protein WBO73_11345 [Gammaproteobacteria bacterium]
MSEDYLNIFLLSHMRAFTSLAGHIIGSHPAINGYFEMHISYDDASALDKQLDVFQDNEVLKENSHYLFDKLLHNDYQLKPELPGLEGIKILVALREPENTIKSIINLFARKDTDELYALPYEAAKYYIERLEWLAEFSRKVGQGYYYFDAELLQKAPEILLPAMSGWLDLDSPLSGRYKIFNQSGEAGKGDSSKRIHSGKIDKTTVDYSHILIPHDELKSALSVYRDCRQQLIDNAIDSITR